jgi:DNA/RNA endonuclease G (NUC1)
MKKILLLLLAMSSFYSVYAQGIIVHKQAGAKDTVVISTVDSITFSANMNIFKNTGKKDTVQLSTIDSLTFDQSINPAPVLSSITPTTAATGSPDFILTVQGKNFLNSSEIVWNGTVISTDYVSATELQASIPTALVSNAGSINVAVFTSGPGGGTSSALTFTVAAATVTVEGFEKGTKTSYAAADVTLSTGSWNLSNALIGNSSSDRKIGVACARVKVSGTVTMNFDLKSGAGTVAIKHAKYGKDGTVQWGLWYSTDSGNNWTQADSTVTTTDTLLSTAIFHVNKSGLVRFSIHKVDTSSTYRVNIDSIAIQSYGSSTANPVPVLSSISPTVDTVGAGDLTLTVTGNNFIDSTYVTWNSAKLTTTKVSSTQLTAIVPAADFAARGTANVAVFTPNGGTSSAISFSIEPGVNSPVPALSYFSPIACSAGSDAFNITVTGSDFVTKSVVKWNDTELATTYLSQRQLMALVPANLLTSAGTANISVYSAPPLGGTSVARKFTVTTGPVASSNLNLTMGNPSNATADTSNPNNYLIERGQYCESYNRDRGIANWVAWELDASWLGSATRGDFKADSTLPPTWYYVSTSDYSNTGFSRGHMCPSADRTNIETNNDSVFLMTNIIPQTQAQNGGPWETLEGYCRSLAQSGNKLYIYSGTWGEGGTGLYGYLTSFAGGKVTVPAKTWKVIMILPAGSNDVSRVTDSTRCIAVLMNNDVESFSAWTNYRVSVDSIEALTGYDFFPNVPKEVQAVIEAKVDNQ